MPKVSVILTVYNKPQWLKQSIDSVVNQTFQDWELIIMEDNSPDPLVREIIETYTDDPRVTAVFSDVTEEERYKTTRYATLINQAVNDISSGDYITYLTDDDYYYPHRLAVMVKELEEKNASVVYGNQDVVDADGNCSGVREVSGILDDAWNKVDHNSVMHAKECFIEVGGWADTPDIWGGGDAHFWRKLTEAGYKFYPVEGASTEAKRYHEGSVQWLVHNGKFFPE